MTVSTTTNRAGFVCNGVTYQFSFNFKILANGDLQVYLYNTTTRLTSQLTLNVDYTVDIASPGPGGTVTLIGAYGPPCPPGVIPGSNYTLTLLRAMPRTQEIDFLNGDSLDERNIEGMGDKLTMMVQDLDNKMARTLAFPPTSEISNISVPDPAPGAYLRWNSSGDGLENASFISTTLVPVSDYWKAVVDDANNLPDALTAMGLDSSLSTLSLPDNVTISNYIKTLLDDADAATARTTLGALSSSDLVSASESVAGIAELATQTETNAGTDDARIVTPYKLANAPMLYRRNAIINGDMRIAQRGTSFSAAASGTLPVDRFYIAYSSDAVQTLTQDSDVPSGYGFRYSIKWDITTADSSIGSSQYAAIAYKVEGYDFARFVGQTATLSFWVKSPKTGTHCVAFRNSGTDRSYVVTYTVNSADTWEKKTVTLTFDYSGGTWDYTNGTGLQIAFVLACGSGYQTTANAWQSGNYLGTSAQVNCLDSADNNFYLTGVQLEVGSVATPFEFTSFEEELALCQRYYEKSHNCSFAPGTSGAHQVGNLYVAVLSAYEAPGTRFAVTKRTAPTITIYSPVDGASGKCYSGGANRDATAGYIGEASFGYITGSSYTTPLQYHWVADAEL